MKLTRAQELALINYAVTHIVNTFLDGSKEPVAKVAAAHIAKAKQEKKRKGYKRGSWSAAQHKKFRAYLEKRKHEKEVLKNRETNKETLAEIKRKAYESVEQGQ